jgi:hypothetical protein
MSKSTLDAMSRANWEKRKRAILALQAPTLVALQIQRPAKRTRKRRPSPNQLPLPFGGPVGSGA